MRYDRLQAQPETEWLYYDVTQVALKVNSKLPRPSTPSDILCVRSKRVTQPPVGGWLTAQISLLRVGVLLR